MPSRREDIDGGPRLPPITHRPYAPPPLRTPSFFLAEFRVVGQYHAAAALVAIPLQDHSRPFARLMASAIQGLRAVGGAARVFGGSCCSRCDR